MTAIYTTGYCGRDRPTTRSSIEITYDDFETLNRAERVGDFLRLPVRGSGQIRFVLPSYIDELGPGNSVDVRRIETGAVWRGVNWLTCKKKDRFIAGVLAAKTPPDEDPTHVREFLQESINYAVGQVVFAERRRLRSPRIYWISMLASVVCLVLIAIAAGQSFDLVLATMVVAPATQGVASFVTTLVGRPLMSLENRARPNAHYRVADLPVVAAWLCIGALLVRRFGLNGWTVESIWFVTGFVLIGLGLGRLVDVLYAWRSYLWPLPWPEREPLRASAVYLLIARHKLSEHGTRASAGSASAAVDARMDAAVLIRLAGDLLGRHLTRTSGRLVDLGTDVSAHTFQVVSALDRLARLVLGSSSRSEIRGCLHHVDILVGQVSCGRLNDVASASIAVDLGHSTPNPPGPRFSLAGRLLGGFLPLVAVLGARVALEGNNASLMDSLVVIAICWLLAVMSFGRAVDPSVVIAEAADVAQLTS